MEDGAYNSTDGVQTLRFNFVGGTGYLYNINWFKMTKTIPLLSGDFGGDNKVDMVDFELLPSDWQNGYEMTRLRADEKCAKDN